MNTKTIRFQYNTHFSCSFSEAFLIDVNVGVIRNTPTRYRKWQWRAAKNTPSTPTPIVRMRARLRCCGYCNDNANENMFFIHTPRRLVMWLVRESRLRTVLFLFSIRPQCTHKAHIVHTAHNFFKHLVRRENVIEYC